jgi:tetratricopeptide (TPR) repeat protein
MRLRRFLFLVIPWLAFSGSFHPAAAGNPLAEADAILASPTLDAGQAPQALALYEGLLPRQGQASASLLSRLARGCFLAGDMAPKAERRGFYEKGRRYGELLLKEQPAGVEGHYWLALNLAGLADVGGKLAGFRLLLTIMQELERALAIDESYDDAGAHRVLGRIYYEAPGRPLSVGNLQKSLRHLSAAVRLAPEDSTNHLYLAETLLRLRNYPQARQELEKVLTSSRNPIRPLGLEEDRRKARRLLSEEGEKLRGGSAPSP